MTPDELQRMLRAEHDRVEIQRSGNSGLYFAALIIVGVIAMILYASR